MPSELEDLVDFLHHGNTQIRQIAVENLVGYSTAQPALFKKKQLAPVNDLKLLVKDYTPIAKNALTILINISDDQDVLSSLATDDAFLESLMLRITSSKEPNANEISMLLANLAKHDAFKRILDLERAVPARLSTSRRAMDQLLDAFVKGAAGSYNKAADYDYLSYLFADIAQLPEGRTYFLTPRKENDELVVPLTKLTVFTDHASAIRRRGVASTIKNVAFDVPSHARLIASDPDAEEAGVNLLPYVLLPLMGPEEYADEDTEGLLDDLQLLPPDKTREADLEILKTHLETVLLLTTTRPAREHLRRIKLYPIIRETHLKVEDEGVREACDRIVQVIARDEEDENGEEARGQREREVRKESEAIEVEPDDEEDEDEQIIDIA